MSKLDDPSRIDEIRAVIGRKPSLKLLYEESYSKIKKCIAEIDVEGEVLELGSGGGFAKDCIQGVITSDMIAYPCVDIILDGMSLPFADRSLKLIFMINVLHHIRDADVFFKEAERTLVPGGRIFIIDPYPGILGRIIYRYFHHEPFDPDSKEWRLPDKGGPLSQANIALAWIIFIRDREKFMQLFPRFRITKFTPHTPLRYWLTGGLKKWCLLPEWAYGFASSMDAFLVKISKEFCCFVDIELSLE